MNRTTMTPHAAPGQRQRGGQRQPGGQRHGRARGTPRRPPWQRAAAGLAALLAVYLAGRGIAELFVIHYADPASYRNDWGGPSLAGVLAVHSGPAWRSSPGHASGCAAAGAAPGDGRRRAPGPAGGAARRGPAAATTGGRVPARRGA